MAVVVVGGHSRSVGKTSVAAGLIAALPEFCWLAVKVTQYGHGVCSADGKPCDCATDDHSWAMAEERSRSGESDSSRYLVAGAQRSLWVRTRQGNLAEAMPRLRQQMAGAANVILESNSIIGFLRPDLYLTVLDPATIDFKDSARLFLDRADAVLLHQAAPGSAPQWKGVSGKLIQGKPAFAVCPPEYVSADLVSFVRQRLVAPAL